VINQRISVDGPVIKC